MAEQFKERRWSTRNRVRAIPLAAAAFGAPGLLRRHALAQGAEVRLTGLTSSDQEQTLFEQILEEFRAANPDITLNYEPVPAEYPTKLQTDVAAGTVADVFYLDSMPAPDFMVNGVLLELDSYMADAGVSADDFYPGLISAFQMNGKTYGLPKDWSSLAMVYNTQALTDAGVANPPTNWDELRAAGEALRANAGDEARICIPAGFDRYLAFHYAAGGEIISEDGSTIAIDTPEAATALDFYYGLYRDGLATTPADAGAEWPGDAFAKNLADIVFEGNWMFPFLADAAPDLEFGISEMPEGPAGKATLAFTVSFSAYAQTEQPDAAWTVINYLTGDEGMGRWTSLGLAMPSRPSLADAWLQQFPEREPFLISGDYARGWQLGPGGEAFKNDADSELQGLFAGSIDVPTALANMQAAAEARITLGGGTPVASPTS
jgi:multiple sugar transport system substrate-binding protein